MRYLIDARSCQCQMSKVSKPSRVVIREASFTRAHIRGRRSVFKEANGTDLVSDDVSYDGLSARSEKAIRARALSARFWKGVRAGAQSPKIRRRSSGLEGGLFVLEIHTYARERHTHTRTHMESPTSGICNNKDRSYGSPPARM